MSKIEKSITTVAGLAESGLVAKDVTPELEAIAARYAVAITPAMAGLIDPADPSDPIGRQFLPDARELDALPGEMADPIGDAAHSPVPGVVHRYPDRVLLKLVSVCAVYCRFCFRREMVGPGQETMLAPDALAKALDYIRTNDKIWEVILTGGDPLMLSPRRIGETTAALADIPHAKVLRWHTRLPVVAPERVTPEVVAALKRTSQAVWVALHANHPREFTPAAREACLRLVDAGIPLVSQSVLLKGVNDDPLTLELLMRTFVECRVKPYYLHHGDLAPGTSHLRTTIAKGQELVEGLRGRLSGLCQPSYMLDLPGGHGKVPIGPCMLHRDTEDDTGATYVAKDFTGCEHRYIDQADDAKKAE